MSLSKTFLAATTDISRKKSPLSHGQFLCEAAYHELTMVDGGENLPRSYLVKQCKTNLNSLCHITRTPGVEGVQLDFMSELQKAIRKKASFVIFNPICINCYGNQFFVTCTYFRPVL